MTKRRMLSVRVDPETVRLLDTAVKRGLGSRSDLVRAAIRAHLAREAHVSRPWDLVAHRAGSMSSGERDRSVRVSELVKERLRRQHERSG